MVKPPPTMKYCSQRRKADPFILMEFMDPLNNNLFSAWLNKVEAVNISVHIEGA